MPANVEIVRKEMIKPSSPTPHNLKEHKFSYIDQFTPNIYIPLIFYYEANQKYSCQLLKASLSIALTHYYPLAGRLSSDNNYYIDCNDAGALFVEAKVQLDVDLNLHQFIENPDMDDLKHLVPLDHINRDQEEVILAVHINLFGCGGTAIGVRMSHKIGDGNSLVNFMNAWAAICRHGGGDDIMNPKPRFDSASLFPPVDLSTFDNIKSPLTLTKEKIVTKRLIFNKEKLEILKAEVKDHCNPTPTRVEVVSAIIWKRLMKVIGKKTLLKVVHAVNLRSRMHPSLPDCAFGNIITFTPTLPMNEEGVNGYKGLVSNLRVALKSVDENFVKKIQNRDDEYMVKNELFAESISKGEIVSCYMTSWCRFPVYEVDYGWGKPVWVSTVTMSLNNCAVLLTTKNGDGIDVWLNMLEEDASIFDESDVSNLVSCP